MLNAIRFRFTKRSRSKKPDWLLDKYPSRSRSKSTPSEEVSPTASTANILCSRLSVDPSLPSHYRVSIEFRDTFFNIKYQNPRLSPPSTQYTCNACNENCVHIVIVANLVTSHRLNFVWCDTLDIRVCVCFCVAIRLNKIQRSEGNAEINALTGLIGRSHSRKLIHMS